MGCSHSQKLAHAQSKIFQQPWFTNAFAAKVQREVKQLQDPEGTAGRTDSTKPHWVRVASMTKIPKKLLQRPWTPSQVKLVRRLLRWKANMYHISPDFEDECMLQAVIAQNTAAVRLLRDVRHVEFNKSQKNAAITSGGNKAILELIMSSDKHMLSLIRLPIDERLLEWASCMVERRDPMGRPLLRVLLEKSNEGSVPGGAKSLQYRIGESGK